MCGEKMCGYFDDETGTGSPPRVRGKVQSIRKNLERVGITPACAGKRNWPTSTKTAARDHPRVCGEKAQKVLSFWPIRGSPPRVRGKAGQITPITPKLGSPPRVRGKDTAPVSPIGVSGITPACAGKRQQAGRKGAEKRDHPRVCGEKNGLGTKTCSSLGSPPRVRGKGGSVVLLSVLRRITPACAGKRDKERTGQQE